MNTMPLEVGEAMFLAEIESAYQAAAEDADADGTPVPSFDEFLAARPRPAKTPRIIHEKGVQVDLDYHGRSSANSAGTVTGTV